MTNEEIKAKIDSNNIEIQKLLTPNVFTLNTKVRELLRENKRLQGECTHDFGDQTYCKYCYKSKKDVVTGEEPNESNS